MAAAGTPKLPREVRPTLPWGCDLLQHEVIEALLGDQALDTEYHNSTSLIAACVWVITFTNFYLFFPFLLLFDVLFFLYVPAMPFPVLKQCKDALFFHFFSSLFTHPFLSSYTVLPHGLVVFCLSLEWSLYCFGRGKCNIFFLFQSLICSSWFEFFKETG